MSSAKVMLFDAVRVISVPTAQVPHSPARWWVASEMGCKNHPAVVAVGEDWVRHFDVVVMMVTAALARQWLGEEESSWWILGRWRTWSGLACLVMLNSTNRLSWTIMLKISWVGAWSRFGQFSKTSPFTDIWNSFLQKQFSIQVLLFFNLTLVLEY